MSREVQKAQCPTCGIQTHKVYNLNGKAFMMPLSVAGTVENGICLVCDNSMRRKDPPELLVKQTVSSGAGEKPDTCLEHKIDGIVKSPQTDDQETVPVSTSCNGNELPCSQQTKSDRANTNALTKDNGQQQSSVKTQPPSYSTQLKVRVTTSSNNKLSSYPFITLNLDTACTSTNNKQASDAQQNTRPSNSRTKRSKPSPATLTRTSKRTKHPPIPHGTQLEFSRLMKSTSTKQISSLLQSMYVSAILSIKRNNLSTTQTFLASNGKLYPDLRKNFGKYSNIKQCGVCKQRVQGAYYCRLKHVHLEVKDWDGGDSAAVLRELMRKSVEELVGMQRVWRGETEAEDSEEESVLLGAAVHGKDWSLDQLNEDLLFHVASYVGDLSSLISFCSTSKRASLMLSKPTSDALFRGVYNVKFGARGGQGYYDCNLTFRERWDMTHNLKRALKSTTVHNPWRSATSLRRTIGVLSTQDEQDAIFYDNPVYADPEQEFCNGYFGMHLLHLPPPPNATRWSPPVLLHGDFNGVRIFRSLDGAVRDDLPDGGERPGFVSLGDDEFGGQVLSIIHVDDWVVGSPCCFIGYASGRVAAITATLSKDGKRYNNFIISSQTQSHECEVTCFAFAKIDNSTTHLFSACCGGAVRFYPNALKTDDSFNLESVLAFTNFYGCGIFSLTSSVIKSDNTSFSVLCTGDRDGKVRLWLVGDDITSSKNFRHLGQYNSSIQIGTGFHLVTKAKFISDTVLVTGTNQGSVRIWCLECKQNPGRSIGKGPLPKLHLRYDLMSQHPGSVEVCMNIGNVLLTSGGDGKILGWDINSGMKIGTINCHPGKKLTQLETGEEILVKSSVIDFVLNVDGKLISLCRDGILAEWSFLPASKKAG